MELDDVKDTDYVLERNIVQCKHCGDILESRTVHDFKMCSCGKVGVDGGVEYQRLIGEPEDMIDLSVVRKVL